MPFTTRACPVCGHTASTPVVASPVAAESLSLDALSQRWRGLLRETSFFTYCRCASCGLLYNPVYFSQEQLNTLYASMGVNMPDVPPRLVRKTQERYFATVSPLLSGKTYLELGPDVGYFAYAAAQSGLFDKFYFVEPNRDVWDDLRRSVAPHEPVLYASLDDIGRIDDDTVSFISAVHLVDHLLDPIAMLRQLRGKLTRHSIIACVTHNEQSLMARALKNRWPAFCLQHPQVFNKASIRRLLQAAGFTVLRSMNTRNYFTVKFLLENALWAGLKIRARLPQALDSWDVGLKLGNMLTIARPQ